MSMLVVFGEDFGRHPHCLEHLIRRMPAGTEVLWVETAGLRGPKLTISDLKRSLQKIKGWFQPPQTTLAGVQSTIPNWIKVIRPISLPWWGNPLVRLFNKISVLGKIRKHLQQSQQRVDVVISSLPNTDIFLKELGEKKSVYYCVDEFKLWPGFPTKVIEKLEKKMLQKSDLVLCTSSFLLQTRKQQNKNCVLFTHGVDVNKFKIAPPLDSKTVIFGYYGLVDERCDQGILVDLAQKCEQSEIHIWGKVTVPISQLTTHKNIIFHGEVPYHSLAKQISNVHCFILPYKVNEQTQTIYPLKIKEYLLTGRPIVTTHLPDMPSLLPHLAIANNPQEFLQHCQLIAKEKSFFRPQQVAFFEKTEDWGHKAKEFIQLLHTP